MTIKSEQAESSDKEARGRARNRARRSESSDSDSSSSSSSSSSSDGSSSSDDSSSDSSPETRPQKRAANQSERRHSPVNRKKGSGDASARQRSRSPYRPSRRSQSPKPTKVVINNLTKNVNKDHVMEIFSHYGEVKSIDFPNDRFGPARMVAYVEYSDHGEAEKALKFMDGGQVDGQVIGIRAVLPMRRRPLPPRRPSPPPMGRHGGWNKPPPWRRSPPRRRRSPLRRPRSPPPRRRTPPRRRRERSKSSSSESR